MVETLILSGTTGRYYKSLSGLFQVSLDKEHSNTLIYEKRKPKAKVEQEKNFFALDKQSV